MIYKVFYQESFSRNIRRETTKILYIKAENIIEARKQIEQNTPYNIEFIQELAGNHLAYEQEHANFFLTEFSTDETLN